MIDSDFFERIKQGEVEAVKELLSKGADVHQQDEHGWLPLNWAAGRGNLDMVRLLTSHGADVFETGRDNRTPYMIALAAGHVEIVRYLRDVEQQTDTERAKKSSGRGKKYCRAYYLRDVRRFPSWSEKKDAGAGEASKDRERADDDIVFVHQDYTVTQSMYHNENVLYDRVTDEWVHFLERTLAFKVPDDLDLIVSKNEPEVVPAA